MKRSGLILLFLSLSSLSQAQYAPRANWLGSTAIPKDSAVFINWANTATVTRGFLDLRNPLMGKVSAGDDAMALGAPDGQTVSLGDGGQAVLSFNPPIVNGPGYDFAVFENGFHIRNNSDSDYLELAFVEVSSDGQYWVRFPCFNDNDTALQLGPFTGSRASKIHNLAGKYTVGYGTPFDLDELKDSVGLDVMNIRFVRVIDVVGCLLDEFATYDSRGHKMNDPFPTNFMQGGFDLDAVGVIYNQHSPNGINPMSKQFSPFPNPVNSGSSIQLTEKGMEVKWELYSLNGKLLHQGIGNKAVFDSCSGIYRLILDQDGKQNQYKLIIQ